MVSDVKVRLNNSVKYPTMRYQLIDYILELSDRDYQVEYWLGDDKKHADVFANLDEVIHFLFDDSLIAECAENSIGFILVNETEAALISKITGILEKLINVLGDVSDRAYLERPEWGLVIKLAQQLFEVMNVNDRMQNNQLSS